MKWFTLIAMGYLAVVTADTVDDILSVDYLPFLTDEKKWKKMFDCLDDKGPCGQYQFIRNATPYIYPDCESCTPTQRDTFMRRKKLFEGKYPKDMEELDKKYAKTAGSQNSTSSSH